MSYRYYLTEEREVTKAEFVSAERRAGFVNTMNQPAEPATGGFTGYAEGAEIRGRMVWVPTVADRPVIVRAEQTCFACPAQWDAWDADGSQYYLRYRHSFGSAERVRRGEGEWLDGDRRETVGEFETDEDDGGVISLEKFCERAGLELRTA
jgi:hypothetical protein